MSSAIDVFREQREAADQVHARLTEISTTLDRVRHQVYALVKDDELRAVLRQEESWLERARLVVSDIRSFASRTRCDSGPASSGAGSSRCCSRWGPAAVAGASYGWATKPYAAEVDALRARMKSWGSSSVALSR